MSFVFKLTLLCTFCLAGAAHAAAPAATMNDVKDHFVACFHPPSEAAGSRVTFYFSFNRTGGVVAPPRTVWLGFKGSAEEKSRRIADFRAAFGRCLPVALDPELASTIPGKVYFLQYIVASSGTGSQVLLRPFGSHGGGGEPIPELVMPEPVPFASGPAYRSVPGRGFGSPLARNPHILTPARRHSPAHAKPGPTAPLRMQRKGLASGDPERVLVELRSFELAFAADRDSSDNATKT